MPIEEICKLIAQRLLQGCMNHQQFTNYYDFLGLEGYKLCHEYHFFEQLHSYRQFISYYIKFYDKLTHSFPSESLTSSSFSIVPENWYNYTRMDVQVATRRNAVKSGLEKYVRWEEQTLNFFQDMYLQTTQQGFIDIALHIKQFILSVEDQIKKAKKELLEIKSTDYDLPTIVAKQESLIKKYQKKMKQVKPRKEKEHDESA